MQKSQYLLADQTEKKITKIKNWANGKLEYKSITTTHVNKIAIKISDRQWLERFAVHLASKEVKKWVL